MKTSTSIKKQEISIKKRNRNKKVMCIAIISSMMGITAFSSQPSLASCYGTGYSRYCDGIGGYGATYSKRGDFGSTTYSNGRRQTYSTYYY
tara:strand:+ start:215 stop:487 length:273 start_codon:yes stop_codon:yes gene_type:complete